MGIKLHTPQMRTSGSKPWLEYKRKTYPPNTAPPVTVRTVTPSMSISFEKRPRQQRQLWLGYYADSLTFSRGGKDHENCIFEKIDTFFCWARCFFANFLAEVKKLPVRNFFHLRCFFQKNKHANTDFQRNEPLPKMDQEWLSAPTVWELHRKHRTGMATKKLRFVSRLTSLERPGEDYSGKAVSRRSRSSSNNFLDGNLPLFIWISSVDVTRKFHFWVLLFLGGITVDGFCVWSHGGGACHQVPDVVDDATH